MKGRREDHGVVLVTILAVMALCVTVIVAMTNRSEEAVRSTSRELDQQRVQMLATSAEALVLAALQHDLETAPQADGPPEPWVQIGQSDTLLALGPVQVRVWDESSRFNLNTVLDGSPTSRHYLKAIVAEAGLPPEVAVRIAAALRGGRPLLGTAELAARAGLSIAEVEALAPLVTSTPEASTTVNINSASPLLLQAMLQNPDRAAHIVARRATELITPKVLDSMGVILPVGLSLRSDVFGLEISAASGSAILHTRALVQRWIGADGLAHATVSARKWMSARVVPDQADTPPPPG